jgi:hypothetical protein
MSDNFIESSWCGIKNHILIFRFRFIPIYPIPSNNLKKIQSNHHHQITAMQSFISPALDHIATLSRTNQTGQQKARDGREPNIRITNYGQIKGTSFRSSDECSAIDSFSHNLLARPESDL